MKMRISSRTGAHKHFTTSPTYSSRLTVTHAPRAAIVTLLKSHLAKLKSACKECRASVMQPPYLSHEHSWRCVLMEELCWQLHRQKRTIPQSRGQQGHRLLSQGHLRAKLQAPLYTENVQMYTNDASTQTAVCAKIHAKKDKEYFKKFWTLMSQKSKARMQTPCSLLASTIKRAGWGTYPPAQRTSLVIRNSNYSKNSGKQHSPPIHTRIPFKPMNKHLLISAEAK